MLSKKELILLKAIFDPQLHYAIMDEDQEAIEESLKENYRGEYTEEDTKIDVVQIKTEYENIMETDAFQWAG